MQFRKHLQKFLLVVIISTLAIACKETHGPTKERTVITIGAMRPGTSWYIFAATLATLLAEELPPSMEVEVIARGGAIGNPILVDRGEATIAIAQAATSAWARSGHPLAYKGRKHHNIRALVGGLNKVWLSVMLQEEYIARTGNSTLEEALSGSQPLRIVMKPAGSVVPVFADMVLDAFGTSRDQIIAQGGEITQVSANQIASILRDGRADLYFETAIRGHPTVTEITTTTDVRFVDLPNAVLEKIQGPGITPTLMPEYFKGQSKPTQAVDMGTVLITHKDLPEDLAYRITKVVCENKEAMAMAHKAWLAFNPNQGGNPANIGIPLHPGAKRYFEETGLL